MQAKLIVVGGDVKTTEVNLKLPCVIGRGRGTGLMLPHPLVSRQHCEIYEHEQQLVVRDLGSLNGTYINNTRLTEPTLLPSGDLLTIGTVTFRAEYFVDPNLAPPETNAQTVRGAGAKTSPAPAKAPVQDEPDFAAFDEAEDVADVEVEEYSSGIVKDADALPAMSSSDDIDIMSMLDDEIEEVADEPPPQPSAKKPAAPAKKIETPPDHGTKPTQAGNRWTSPGAPAADLNETLREPAKKPEGKGGPGKASASAKSDEADDFLATLGIAAASQAAHAAEELTTGAEPANVATAEETEDFAPEAEQRSETDDASFAETLLPPEPAASVDDFALEDIELVDEIAELDLPAEAPQASVETEDQSLLANLGLEESPAVQPEEPVAEDSLQAPLLPKFAEPQEVEELLDVEDIDIVEEGVEEAELPIEPQSEAWTPLANAAETAESLPAEPVAEDSLDAPATLFQSEPVAEEIADIELLEEDDFAEPQLAAEDSADPVTPPASNEAFLADLGLSSESLPPADLGEPIAEDSFEAPSPLSLDDALETPIEVSETESFALDMVEEVEEIADVDAAMVEEAPSPATPVATDDAFLSELGLEEPAPVASHFEPAPQHVADPPLPPAPEAVVDVPLAGEPTAAEVDDLLADVDVDTLPPLPLVAETLAEDSLLAPQLHAPPEATHELAAESIPSSASADGDDFLSELGLDEVTPVSDLPEAEAIAPLAEPTADAALPEPLVSESIAQADEVVEEVEIADIELVDELEEQFANEDPVAMEPIVEAPFDLEPVAAVEDPLPSIQPVAEETADFLADLGLDAPVPDVVEVSDVEAVEEIAAIESTPEIEASITPPVEALAEFPPQWEAVEEAAAPAFDAERAAAEFTPAAVELAGIEGVEEVFDLDVEEVALDDADVSNPASPPLPVATPIAAVVDTGLLAGEFVSQSPAELSSTAETINNFDSALPLAQPLAAPVTSDLSDDEFAAEMFGDTIAETPAEAEALSDIEPVAETDDVVEMASDEAASWPTESAVEPEADFTSEAPVAIAPVAPRVMPTPLHVSKPYAYANPVARFPAARWAPPLDEGPYIQPARFPHAAPRPLNGPPLEPSSEVPATLAALPLVAAPLAEELVPQVPESADVAEVTDVSEVAEWSEVTEVAEVSELSDATAVADIEELPEVSEVAELTDIADVDDLTNFMEASDIPEVTEVAEGTDIEVSEVAEVTDEVEAEPLPLQPEPEASAEVDEDLDAFLRDLEK